MKLNSDALIKHLAGNLLPVYLISGNEPLLTEESISAIQQAALKRGFTDLVKCNAAELKFDQASLNRLTENYSLFAEKRRIYLDFGDKANTELDAWLSDFLDHPSHFEDTCLIIQTPKLSPAQQKKSWVQKIDKLGAIISIWRIERAYFPQWLFRRAEAHNVKLARGAVQFLTEHTEGNLLAAAQIIQKLALLKGGVVIEVADVQPLLAGDARYEIFDLGDSCLQGDLVRALRIFSHLQEENAESVLILWVLLKELRIVAGLKTIAITDVASFYRRNNIWDKRMPLYQIANQRLQYDTIMHLLTLAQKIDLSIKGLGIDSPWRALKHLIIAFCTSQVG